MQQLNKKIIWIFFFQNLIAWFFVLGFFSFWGIGMIFGLLSITVEKGGEAIAPSSALAFAGGSMIIYFILLFGLSYLFAYLGWLNYRYELKPEGFRKEYGVIWKKYVTIPYGRIQNVDIYRGILARLLGLSDLNIQTAGTSNPQMMGEGRLPGLTREEAEKLRDELVGRVNKPHAQSGQGL